ncbi:MAG: alpha/beta hydrolase [Propionibacteriaceae bacterium]|jgi:pimeloyl-ACP methyl ester carboxylesterase|nr:alpha/beta hydrolase [Propionibacteriaceae bacterium]
MANSLRPTLLLLHGPGQSPPAWQGVVERLDPSWPMFAPWLKGLKPTGGPKDFSVAPAVDDLFNTMELRGIEQADLVGFSLGGLVALRAAAKHPGRIAHLVLVSTPAIPPQSALTMQRRLISLLPASKFTADAPKDLALRGLDALLAIDAHTDLKLVSAPSLVVVSSADPAGPDSAATYGKGLHAAVRKLQAPDTDLPAHAPVELARFIEDFCSDRLAGEPA